MKKKAVRAKPVERVMSTAKSVFRRLSLHMESAVSGDVDFDAFASRSSGLVWSILDTVSVTAPAVFEFTPADGDSAGTARDLMMAGLSRAGVDFEVFGVHVIEGVAPNAGAGPALVVGWYLEEDSRPFLVGCRTLVPRAAEIARAWVVDAVRYVEMTPLERCTPRQVEWELYRLLCAPTGEVGDPVTRFRLPSEWSAVIPNAAGERVPVDWPEPLGAADFHHVTWYQHTHYDTAHLARWVGFRAVERTAAPLYLASRRAIMLRCFNAREVIALAHDASDMAELCESVSDLRLMAGTVADFQRPREVMERAALAVSTVADILAQFGVRPDGFMAQADDERLLRHPVAMLLLSAELEGSLGRDTPIGAARLALAPVGGDPFTELELAWRRYRTERRYLATHGSGDAPPTGRGITEARFAWREEVARLFDIRCVRQPLTSLRLPSGKPLNRVLSALERGEVIASRDAAISALPHLLQSLYSTPGFGETAFNDLLGALWLYAHTWRMQLSGCTPESLAEAETRGASARDLASSLDDLASLFE